jgi:DNA-binding ferritin-like protein (Dps family)
MLDSIIKLIIGDLEEKREYKQMMKRVDALPEDYRFAFRKIQKYMFSTGIGIDSDGGIKIFADLVDWFEASAAEGKQVLDVMGNDVGAFVEELASASITYTQKLREKLNKEVMEKFDKEGQ